MDGEKSVQEGAMHKSTSYEITKNLLESEPADLHPFLIALFQFGMAPWPSGGEFWGSSLLNRVQRHDNWAGQQPRRLARLGLLRRVQQSKDGASYIVEDPEGIGRALAEHGLDRLQRLPGDFFDHVSKINRAA
jgi:hypothetical protein